MSWLTKISIFNRWITILIAFVIIGVSIFGTLQLKTEMLPDMELPFLVAFGNYQGHSPEDAMNDISIPIEEEMDKLDGLKHIQSTSTEGAAMVFATFEYGTDLNKAEKDIKERIQNREGDNTDLQSMLESEDLIVTRISLEMFPLLWITVSGDNGMTSAQVREVAENLVDQVSTVKGILPEDKQTPFMKRWEIQGGDEAVLVIPDVEALNGNDIPVSWLVDTLKSKDEYASISEIQNTALTADTSYTIDDIADVIEPVPASYTDGNPSVSVLWRKDPEANTVDVANSIMSKVREFEKSDDCPDGISINVVSDQSTYIESSINNLALNAVIGLILAAVIVLLFLWAFRASLIITVSIPICILIAFLLMWAFDVTINILTLSGLAIAVGRIVDNSIVSLENIYRHMQRNENFRQACINGVKEIAMPITSATIATVVIFVPLVMVGGLVGELFRPFALTVTFALLASLLVALMLVPPLSSFMGTKKVSFEGYDNWYTRLYTSTLRWSLGHRAITLLLTIAIFAASIFIIPLLGTSFLETGGEKAITVEITMPYGNSQDLAYTIKQVETEIDTQKSEDGQIERYYAYMGSIMGGVENGGSIATVMIDLSGNANMARQADILREKLNSLSLFKDYPNTVTVTPGSSQDAMMGAGKLEIWVVGNSDASIDTVGEMTGTLTDMIRELETSGDIENLESELVASKGFASAKWSVDITEETGAEWTEMRYGWPITQMGQTGPTVLIDGNSTGISVPGVIKSLDEDNIGVIRDLRIETASPVKLSSLADVDFESAALNRAEGGYAGTITATILAGDVGAVNDKVQGMIDKIDLKDSGIKEIEMGGLAEQMMEGFTDMGKAIGIAILIVLVVLIISFRSWLTPLLIMVSMPLASIGAVLALLITGKTLGMSAMMGILMLVGIVLTNAIVYLTFVDDLRKEGYNAHDALMNAGRVRLRPILMTALTTMIALIPLAVGFGEGVFMAAELGVVVIGGLFSSTLLTLIVVPVLYSLTERFRRKART